MFYLYRCGLGADQGTTAFLAPRLRPEAAL